MPNHSASIAATFSALADPTRLAVVQQLSEGPATVSQLASGFPMSLPAFTQHLAVLEQAGLLTSCKVGRVRTCRLDPTALADAEHWLAAHRRQWEHRLDRLEAHLANTKPASGKTP